MLIKMPPRFYKHKLILDEGLYPRKLLSRTNSRYNVRHIKHDLNSPGISDRQIYEIAVLQKRIIVTYNIADFIKLATQSKRSGVIGVTQSLTPEQLDTKLNSLLSKSSEKSFYGKYTSLNKPD